MSKPLPVSRYDKGCTRGPGYAWFDCDGDYIGVFEDRQIYEVSDNVGFVIAETGE